jgi:hypothetical protein
MSARVRTCRIVLDRTDGAEFSGRLRDSRTAQWCLVPFWVNDPRIDSRMVNVRMETLSGEWHRASGLGAGPCCCPSLPLQPQSLNLPGFAVTALTVSGYS